MAERERCEHGAAPGECAEDDCLFRPEVRNALLGLAGSMTAADDQARAMTDAELAELLLTGKWTTIEVHEAGRRLASRRSDEGVRANTLTYEVRRAARDARSAADVIQGIPAFLSMWRTFDRIARDLERGLEAVGEGVRGG